MAEAALVAGSVPGPTTAAVRVREFGKRYGKRDAVHSASLTVAPGDLYGLIGPDGAGKSTLLKAVAGVLTFDTGSVEVFGVALDSERAAERVKGRLGFMPQGLGLNLYPELSIEENVDFFARLRLVPAAELAARKQRLLGITRLDAFRDRPMKHLSGGMKQKLGLVCTLIHQPDLVILDEPTTGVDPVSRRDFWAILGELMHERRMTALVSTAYMDEASRFHRLAFMHAGRVLAEGEPDGVRQTVPGCVVTFATGAPAAALLQLRARGLEAEAVAGRVRALVPEPESGKAMAEIQGALGEVPVSDVTSDEPDLEDAFVWLLREQDGGAREGPPAPVPPGDSMLPPRSSGAAARDAVLIAASDLTRDFGLFRAVDGVSFRVRAGEVFGLLGANGAGKTTVIKMLTGILRPTAGLGQVAGVDMRRPGIDIKRRIGYMSQAFSLYQDMSALENIRLYAGIYGLPAAEARRRADWVVAMSGLSGHENSLTSRLPMGMRQRLALGCALLHRPQAVFLDEPTSGVDPIGRRRFWGILFGLAREEGVAVLVTTHYMSEAEQCDRLGLMFAGRLVADAPPVELRRAVEAEAGQVLEAKVDEPAGALAALTGAGYSAASAFGNRVQLLSRDPDRDRERIAAALGAAGVTVHVLAPRPLTMEEVFVHRVTALEREAGARTA